MYTMDDIKAVDPEVAAAIQAESDRQNSHIELIASENWVSHAVMSAMGSVMTNKYAEGYPGHRYYGGCECADVVEELARDRDGYEFGPWRTSDTRKPGQFLRNLLQHRALWCKR